MSDRQLLALILALLAIGVALILGTAKPSETDGCDEPIFTEHTVTVTCTVGGQSATHTEIIEGS